MHKTAILKKVVFIVCVGMLIPSLTSSVRAATEDEELQAQIKTLNERIINLEKQLAEKNNPVVTQPPAPSSVPVNDWDPFQEMQEMRKQINRMSQNSVDRSLDSPSQAGLFNPQVDIKETNSHYIITMDLPGMEKDNINVEIKSGALVISGERTAQMQVDNNQMFRQERSFGRFLRTIPLPDGAKPDDMAAEYKNGVLEIKMGRMATTKPSDERGGKKITVN